jgi:short-subunit dehydrogenase
MSSNQKVAIITGSSSGIGYETAFALAENGWMTYATMRDTKKQNSLLDRAEAKNLKIRVIELDVDKDKSVEEAIKSVKEKEKRIDLLVNNAGFSLIGAAEDLSLEEVYSIFNTNVFGVYRSIRNVIPIMRKQRSGMIINISSLNAIFPSPFCSAYVASKCALEGITQSLRYELMDFGIKVTAIEPGAINTNVVRNGLRLVKKVQHGSGSVYEEITKKILNKSKELVTNGSHPRLVANLIVQIANTNEPEVRYQVGEDAEKLYDTRNKMNDKEFDTFMVNMMKQFGMNQSFDLEKDKY